MVGREGLEEEEGGGRREGAGRARLQELAVFS